ncbi:oxidoreductase [Staphylococcus lutrae]|uniref:Oxidoreductase n=1 Tax=Staphylococcus lutrae TaxID=155085 RepID=A0AAC9WIW0_9STAP|nr:oxidoreductase [Staphylococcus lutrae]ARJ50520.1 oxidoreductase [Staphylococcus lutrae]PNZ37422.1 oxidoreductase [Staphylococcus lutrae]
MTNTFKAFRVTHDDTQLSGEFTELTIDALSEGDVTIRVHYSSINYKDVLAAQSHNKIIRKYPIIPGIDLAGVVIASQHPSFKKGDKVIATGYDLGVKHDGGFSEVARVNGEWLVPLPEQLTLEEAMILGTAGLTAAISIQLLEDNEVTCTQGPVLVRGATGGVGILSVMMLNEIGYQVIASSGQTQYYEQLQSLGAHTVIPRIESLSDKALAHPEWQAAIDPVGGATTAEVLKRIQPHGAVALSGNVSGAEFTSTVYPFILRGVRLLGADSVDFPMTRRQYLWQRLAKDLKPRQLHDIKTIIPFSALKSALERAQQHDFIGRIIVDLRSETS